MEINIFVQRFKEKWRRLITVAKKKESDPYGGLFASFSVAVKEFKHTLGYLFIFHRLPEK